MTSADIPVILKGNILNSLTDVKWDKHGDIKDKHTAFCLSYQRFLLSGEKRVIQ